MDWNVLIAGVVNTVVVLGVVQLLKIWVPGIRAAAPWLLPLVTPVLGPAIAAVQGWVGAKLGVAIDLSPILAVFTGPAAVAIHQTVRQWRG